MLAKYEGNSSLHLLDPIYDLGKLRTLRAGTQVYIHGHSAGGTNPSLVEIMHFGTPVFAYDCIFNHYTTEDKAAFFKDAADLRDCLTNITPDELSNIGKNMLAIACVRYTWEKIGEDYFKLLAGGT